MIEINKIIYAKDLARELLKHPDDFIIVGKNGDDLGRCDQQIVSLYRRDVSDAPTTVLNIENFNETGLLKYYK